MANPEITTITSGVTRLDCGWGYALKGDKERLIAARFAEPSWFADGKQRDARGRIVRTKYLTIDGRDVRTVARARGPCWVCIHYTPAEAEANRVEQSPELPQPEDKAALPGTIAEHREKLLANVTDVERFAQCFLDDETAFYRLSTTDQQKLSEVWTHVRSIIQNATIRPRRFAVIEGRLGLAKPGSTL